MNRTRSSQSGIFTPRVLFAFSLCSIGLLLAVFSLSARPQTSMPESEVPVPRASRNAPTTRPPSPRKWQPVASPSAVAGFMWGVTCNSSSDCWAVGATGDYKTLIQHWDGISWAVVTSPNGSPTQDNVLYEVTCNSSSDCWAVGIHVPNGYQQTLIEHWDGNTWSIVPSPNISTMGSSWLESVACTSASNCWAVGWSAGPTVQTLIERWDGTAWLIVMSPNSGTIEQNYLRGVACASASDCWAVGFYGMYGIPDTFLTLIQHWDGTSWSIVNSPNPDPGYNLFFSVTCSSASSCWAVGKFNSENYQTLTAKWDGISWAAVTSPNSGLDNSLEAITCVSTSNCWAVGAKNNGHSTLIENWDGSSWSVVPSPDLSSDNLLASVACPSVSDCWAVGVSFSVPFQALTEHWDGVSWTIPSAPVKLNGVVSRKVHGTVGPFDINLPQTGPSGIECRFGTPTGDFQMVFTFGTDLASVGAVSTNVGSVSSSSIGPGPNQYVVNLTSIPNAQYVTVTLNAVQDVDGGTGDASGTMGMLRGDTNGNGVVNSTDLAQTKSRVGQVIDTSTFRSDIQPNGSVNAADISLVKFNMGSALP